MATETKTIEIPAPDQRTMEVRIKGRTPLLCDRYGEATIRNIQDREQNPNRPKTKTARDPEAEFAGSLYVIEPAQNGMPARYGFPAVGIMKSLATAGARFTSAYASTLYGALTVPADLVEIEGSEPKLRIDPRGIKGQRSSLIYRAEFTEWEMTVPVLYDATIIAEEQVLSLFYRAGLSVGIGNWRPEKKGQFGQWEVAEVRA